MGDGLLNRADNHLCFFTVVLGDQEIDLFSLFRVSEKFFGSPIAVMIDHRHSSIQNGLRGAIVLLEQESLCVLEVLLKS